VKLGLVVGYSGANLKLPMEQILEAEKLGYDSVWTAEAWGSDAVSPAAWILALTQRIKVGTAIMQMPARTPTCTAMTAMTLDTMSGGRFMLGIGPSGPQVAEGWYGELYGKPMTRTREYIEIMRKIWARKEPLVHQGEYYSIPYNGPDASGLGKPLKSILHGNPNIPIYSAAITPGGLRTAAELADGVFPVWMSPHKWDTVGQYVEEGFAKSGGTRSLDNFDIAPFVQVCMGDDVATCRLPVKEMMALYIGGMGARSKNFYNDYAKRLGYGDAAVKIQDLFLSGKKAEAVAAVPDALVDECALVGPAARIREQLQAWKEIGRQKRIGSLIISSKATTTEALRVIAAEVL
jgi:F420-dependent oxidoreductase-like protein